MLVIALLGALSFAFALVAVVVGLAQEFGVVAAFAIMAGVFLFSALVFALLAARAVKEEEFEDELRREREEGGHMAGDMAHLGSNALGFVRRNPAVVTAGAFALGTLVTVFRRRR